MNPTVYYIVELSNVDGLTETVLVKDEDLGYFINNYNKELYGLINVYGIGPINFDY